MNYKSKTTDEQRNDLERDIKSASTGFVLLRDFPEFAGSISLARKVHEFLILVPSLYAGFVDQLERAVASVPANIAEAHGRGTLPQILQYLRVARGSMYETRALLLVSPVPVPDDLTRMAADVCRDLDKTVAVLAQERLDRLGN